VVMTIQPRSVSVSSVDPWYIVIGVTMDFV